MSSSLPAGLDLVTALFQARIRTYLRCIIIAEYILAVRTWAIWNRHKAVGICLLSLYCIAVVAACVVQGLFLKTLTFASSPSAAVPGCLLIGGNSAVGINFVIVIIVETAVVIFIDANVSKVRLARSRRGVAYVLYRDGLIFYAYLLGISVINFISTLTFPSYAGDLLTGLQRVLHSCLTSRVILNLREASKRTDESIFSANTAQLSSAVVFAPAPPPAPSAASSQAILLTELRMKPEDVETAHISLPRRGLVGKGHIAA
ncbi:hypothetical protein EIP91_002296 [Steccherinum ochraceum]|uniref:Uncharacterized protein n=1 Tax=Steccherinum ochraceum TaxID=92696 RepID=A0A4R0RCE8_9APHY|nr:hypothetical protein EIP91_002296 [Steccherinum ochraceum]